MIASHLPVEKSLLPEEIPEVQRLVDALAAGSCTEDDFLQQVLQLEKSDPDAAWEALSLVDQYFRRKKINAAVFVTVKKGLERRRLTDVRSNAPPAAVAADNAARVGVSADRPAVAEPSIPAFRAGEVIRGRYRITEVLQRSPSEMQFDAVDEVRAELPGVRQRVAIHVLTTGPEQAALLQRVCRLQALAHPGILRIFDVDAEPGLLYMTREPANGRSLQALIEQNPRRLEQSVARLILGAVADALAHAHAQDVCHGDVRAEHVLITDAGEVRLMGFALRSAGAPPSVAADQLAFARLAYELLSGSAAPRPTLPGESDPPRLHAPAGLARRQWRILRDALNGKSSASASLFSVFGRDNSPGDGRITLLRMGEPPARTPNRSSNWIAAGIVAALLAAGVFLIVTHDAGNDAVAAVTPPARLEAVEPTIQPVLRPAAAVVAEPQTPQPVPQIAVLDLPIRVAQIDGGLPVARIWVRRQGSRREEVTFLWWTESGTAEIDRDFREIPPRMAIVPAGSSEVELLVPLVPDAESTEIRSFYVKIDSPGPGARIGTRNLMQVQLLPRAQ